MKKNAILLGLLITLLISHLCDAQYSKKNSLKINQLIDSINLSLQDNYVFPDKAQNISTFLKAQAKNKVYVSSSKDPQKLAKQIQADIFKMYLDPYMSLDEEGN